MKKSDWYLIISTVFIVWTLDAFTKSLAVKYIAPGTVNSFGIIGFVLHKNPGAMLGMFADLPAVLRIVTLCTGGAFLVFVYTILQYLIPVRLFGLRLGMSLLLGGILGNVTDRTLWGAVIDFVTFNYSDMISPAFNLADTIQWVGYIMIVYSLFKYGHLLWPDQNTRKNIWINPSFQIKYISILAITGLGFSVISGVFSYTYLKNVIDELVIGNPYRIELRFLTPYVYIFLLISIGFLLFLFIVGRIISHRMAGPVYAFETYINDLLEGKKRPFKLRSRDDFKHLEELAKKLEAKFEEHEELAERQQPPSEEDVI